MENHETEYFKIRINESINQQFILLESNNQLLSNTPYRNYLV